VIDTKEGLYILEVLDHQAADSAAFRKDLETLRLQGIQAARQDRVRTYLASLRKQAKVVDRRAEVLQTSAEAQRTAGS
jgi:hypothetical protein